MLQTIATALAPLALGVQALALPLYVLAQCVVVFYASHRWVILWRTRGARARGSHEAPAPWTAPWPMVTVQLPVFNERRVIERLIDAVAALDYPTDRLEIQVLDDSSDDTTTRAAAASARHRARGIDIQHLRRDGRHGFKAGALADGLMRARGEFIAVFDADFVPAPDFLRRLVPHFADSAVGMVQARWTHLNRDASWLTRAQAVMLDSHFLLEHTMRARERLFFNFNGTAGVWRRSCIEQAGGWQHDTLTEDLDLSYRAQLAGWKFAFAPEVETPAELPADLEALKSQQRRWVKGSIQTARKILPMLLARRLPLRIKLEAVVHLTNNLTYPMLLALGLTLLPALIARHVLPVPISVLLQLGVIAFGALPVVAFLWVGQRAAGRPARRALGDVLGALVLGVGLSLNNALATLAALGRRGGEWERTPKLGDAGASEVMPRYRSASRLAGRAESALALYYVALAGFVCAAGSWQALPFVLLLIAGFAWVGLGSLRVSAPRVE